MPALADAKVMEHQYGVHVMSNRHHSCARDMIAGKEKVNTPVFSCHIVMKISKKAKEVMG